MRIVKRSRPKSKLVYLTQKSLSYRCLHLMSASSKRASSFRNINCRDKKLGKSSYRKPNRLQLINRSSKISWKRARSKLMPREGQAGDKAKCLLSIQLAESNQTNLGHYLYQNNNWEGDIQNSLNNGLKNGC